MKKRLLGLRRWYRLISLLRQICLICFISLPLFGCSHPRAPNLNQTAITQTDKGSTKQSHMKANTAQPKQLQFDLPKETTNPVLTIPGKVSNQSTVFINGKEIDVESDGTFTATLELNEGPNTIPIRVVSANTRYSSSATVQYHPQPQKPLLQIDMNDHYSYSHIFVPGQTDPGNSVTINNIPVTLQENGSFLYDIFLTQGEHILTIQARNKDKLTTTIQKKVSVVYPIKQPKLVVMLPEEPGFVSEDRIIITGFTDPYCLVEVYNNYFNSNGKEILSMVSSAEVGSSGKFMAEVYLNPGPNMFTIRVIDPRGLVKEEIRKVYSKNNTYHAYHIPKGYGHGYLTPDTEILQSKHKQAYDKIDPEDK